MSTIKTMFNCMFTPRLTRIYGNQQAERLYEPTALERWGDHIIRSFHVIWKLGLYTSPIVVGILYRKGYFSGVGLISSTKFVTSIGVILVASFCIRALGRASNSTYQKFMMTLYSAQSNLNGSIKRELNNYDFEFFAWPIEYSWKEVDRDVKTRRLFCTTSSINPNLFETITYLPYNIIAYIAIHTFGIRFIYPGSLGILQKIMEQPLQQGRSKLIKVNKGMRYKLQSKELNDVDVMFVDKRNTCVNGNTLVVCCEGNGGFYEIGVMSTPLEAGYSVLGWNHPGFGGSTGTPFPDQEENAVDIVMQFAINKLGFKVEDIILHGWSIGGYSASWVAHHYPNLKSVVIDASFDHILPLALGVMPTLVEPIVKIAIEKFVNLNNIQHLIHYSGPISFIRRTDDEAICTSPGDMSTNRCNFLLTKLLYYRYPLIMGEQQLTLLEEYLSVTGPAQDNIVQKYHVNEDLCHSFLVSYIYENSKSYPMKIGEDLREEQKNQMILYLARKYMKDYKSTHCTPLLPEMFQSSWDINVENDYVFT